MEGRLFTLYSLQIPHHAKVLLIQSKQTNLLIKTEYNKGIEIKYNKETISLHLAHNIEPCSQDADGWAGVGGERL